MTANTVMVHVRVDEELKQSVAKTLNKLGLTTSDAVRILFKKIQEEGALPAGMTMNAEQYDAWFKEKVREALADKRPKISHKEYSAQLRARYK